MGRFPPTAPLGDVRVVSTDRFVLEYFQLHVQSLQFCADIVRIHIRQGDFAHVRVAIVAGKWAVCVYILSGERTCLGEYGNVGRLFMMEGNTRWRFRADNQQEEDNGTRNIGL